MPRRRRVKTARRNSTFKISPETIPLLISTTSLAIVLLICGWLIRRAIRKGTILYSGNRPGMPVRTYSRAESPIGFWAGIALILFVATISTLVAALFILAKRGMNI